MFCKTYKCVVLVGGVLALAGFFDDQSASTDGNKSVPSGAWVRKEGELKIEFDGEGEMKIAPHGNN